LVKVLYDTSVLIAALVVSHLAQAALNAGVDILLTLNPNHFTRLGEAIANLVQVPQ
jgi:predicted nucleic acid-binding protein